MKRQIIISVSIVCIGVALLGYALTQRNTAMPRTFNLSEYGIALEIPGTLSELVYVAQDQSEKGPGTVLHMFVANNCEIATLYQIQKNAISKSGTTWTSATLEQFQSPQGNNPAQVKEFTDFYLVFEPSQTTCASDERAIQEESEKRLALWNALTTAHYMSY